MRDVGIAGGAGIAVLIARSVVVADCRRYASHLVLSVSTPRTARLRDGGVGWPTDRELAAGELTSCTGLLLRPWATAVNRSSISMDATLCGGPATVLWLSAGPRYLARDSRCATLSNSVIRQNENL
jgi:hypothetical protein